MEAELNKIKDYIWDLLENYSPESKTKYKASVELCNFAGISRREIDLSILTDRDIISLIHEGYDELQIEYNYRHPYPEYNYGDYLV